MDEKTLEKCKNIRKSMKPILDLVEKGIPLYDMDEPEIDKRAKTSPKFVYTGRAAQ